MLRDRRGQVRILEALMAATIVFSSLLVSIPINELENVYDSRNLRSIGLNVLVELDRDGDLGRLIAQRNWTELSRRISIMLPLGVSYNLTVYNEEGKEVNSLPISGGGVLGEDIVSIQYLVVERANLRFYVVRLQLAWVR